MAGSPAWHLAASGARPAATSHPLSPALSGVNSSYFEDEEEEMSLLPPPGEHERVLSLREHCQPGAWRPPLARAAGASGGVWHFAICTCRPQPQPAHPQEVFQQSGNGVHNMSPSLAGCPALVLLRHGCCCPSTPHAVPSLPPAV